MNIIGQKVISRVKFEPESWEAPDSGRESWENYGGRIVGFNQSQTAFLIKFPDGSKKWCAQSHIKYIDEVGIWTLQAILAV